MLLLRRSPSNGCWSSTTSSTTNNSALHRVPVDAVWNTTEQCPVDRQQRLEYGLVGHQVVDELVDDQPVR